MHTEKQTLTGAPSPVMAGSLPTNDAEAPLLSVEPVEEPAKQQVGAEAAESVISEKRIGERIKHLRIRKAMGLVELGRHTGLSASFLSQLETGRVVPTLRNLARIAMVFSKDLGYFFEPEPQKLFRVHRSGDRRRLPQSGVEHPSYFFESLGSLIPDRNLDPYFAQFLPAKPGRDVRSHQHVGSEFLYLLSGELDIRHGEAIHHVEPGDAVYFDSGTTHSYLCDGEESASAVIVTMQMPAASGSGTRSIGAAAANGKARSLHQPMTTPMPNGIKRAPFDDGL